MLSRAPSRAPSVPPCRAQAFIRFPPRTRCSLVVFQGQRCVRTVVEVASLPPTPQGDGWVSFPQTRSLGPVPLLSEPGRSREDLACHLTQSLLCPMRRCKITELARDKPELELGLLSLKGGCRFPHTAEPDPVKPLGRRGFKGAGEVGEGRFFAKDML